MTKFWFYIISFVFVILSVLIWISYDHSSFRASDSNFSVGRNQNIERLVLRDPYSELSIHKKKGTEWYLNKQYRANQSAVSQLESILNALEIRRPVSLSKQDSIDAVLEESGIQVEIYVKTYLIDIGKIRLIPYQRRFQSFVVGSDVENQGVYLKKAQSKYSFIVHVPGWEGSLNTIFSPDIDSWLDPTILNLKPDAIKSVSLDFKENPEESFVLDNHLPDNILIYTSQGKKVPMETLDLSKVMRFLSSFEELHYESLLPADFLQEREMQIFEKPFVEISVKSIDGTVQDLKFFRRRVDHDHELLGNHLPYDPNRFYIQLSDNKYALAQYYVFNRIIRPLSFFKI